MKLNTHLLLLPQLRTSEAPPPLHIRLQFNKENFNIIRAVKIKVAKKMASVVKTFRSTSVKFNIVYYSEIYGVWMFILMSYKQNHNILSTYEPGRASGMTWTQLSRKTNPCLDGYRNLIVKVVDGHFTRSESVSTYRICL